MQQKMHVCVRGRVRGRVRARVERGRLALLAKLAEAAELGDASLIVFQ